MTESKHWRDNVNAIMSLMLSNVWIKKLTEAAVGGELLSAEITHEAFASVTSEMFTEWLIRRQHLAARRTTIPLRLYVISTTHLLSLNNYNCNNYNYKPQQLLQCALVVTLRTCYGALQIVVLYYYYLLLLLLLLLLQLQPLLLQLQLLQQRQLLPLLQLHSHQYCFGSTSAAAHHSTTITVTLSPF